MGLLIARDVSTAVRRPVSPRNRKIGSKTKKTERSRTTALRTDADPVQAMFTDGAASFSNLVGTLWTSAA